MLGYKSLVVLAVVAMAGAAHAISDAEEVAELSPSQQVFRQFCLDSRDLINSLQEQLEQEYEENFNADKLEAAKGDPLKSACEIVFKRADTVRASFEEYKKTSLGESAQTFAQVNMAAVPCKSTSDLIRGEKLCKLYRKQL